MKDLYAKNNNRYRRKGRYRIVEVISKNLTKKGKIKGNNKKETETMREGCVHFVYGRNGKLKQKIVNNHDGTCTCRACRYRFRTKPYRRKELEDIIAEPKEALNQLKYLSVFYQFDPKTVDTLSQASVIINKVPKLGAKITKVGIKKQNMEDKKKNKKRNKGNNQYGGWSHTRRV